MAVEDIKPNERLRQGVRAKHPDVDGMASPEYWRWWLRWHRADPEEKLRMERDLTE